jgi:hypothetical protein
MDIDELQTGDTTGHGASQSMMSNFGSDLAVDQLRLSAHVTIQQQRQGPETQVKVDGSGASHLGTQQFDDAPTVDFNFGATLGQYGFGGSHQSQRAESKSPQLGGALRTNWFTDAVQTQNTTTAHIPSQTDSQASESTTRKQRAKPKPRKPRAKKATDTQQAAAPDQAAASDQDNALVLMPAPEPDANYDFAVTDWSDVYLDPKPQLEFGKHEPHLAAKVAATMKTLRAEKKTREGTETPETTMSQLHTAIQARNAALMSQSGPRPRKPPVARQVQWTSPRNDTSIPTTAFAYGTCLHLLTNAIFNRVDCSESKNTEFRNRYLADSTYFTEPSVTSLAEQILVRHHAALPMFKY